ncbi:MAG TPA: acetyltransferase [Anaerolineae bacterium]|nr:acetyltransferase [Anaerolineae bacterium]
MPSKPKLVIWGAGGYALVVADMVRLRGEFDVVGFLDDVDPARRDTDFGGAKVLGGQEQLDLLQRQGVSHLIFGFGDCEARLRLTNLVCEKGFQLATAIHPQATVARDVAIGEGTIIAAGAVVSPGAEIRRNVIINTCASVGHQCIIEDGVHVGPGVRLGGRVQVAQGTWVGIGATVIDRVRIGARSVIGAGAVVIHDIPDGVTAYGVPAKVAGSLPNEHQERSTGTSLPRG